MNRYSPRLGVHRLEDRDNPASPFLAFGATAGGLPLVEVQQPDGTLVARFQAFEDSFRGGVRAAAAELDGNSNTLEVVAAAGPGGGPVIKVFSIDLGTLAATEVSSFFAFEPTYRGGLRVAAGRVTGNTAVQQIVIGADAGGGPRVQLFDIAGTPIGGPLGNFFAFEPSFTGGTRVAAGELDGNPLNGDELVIGAGPGGGPRLKVFRSDGAVLNDGFAFAPDVISGVNVRVTDLAGPLDRLDTDGDAADFSQRNTQLSLDASIAIQPAIDQVVVPDAISLAEANGAFVTPAVATSDLSSGFFPSAGSVLGTTGTVPFGQSGLTGFGTDGLDTAFGSAGLGTTGFGTAGFSPTGFGTGLNGFGSGFNTFGNSTLGGFGTGFGSGTGFTTTGTGVGTTVFTPISTGVGTLLI